MSELSEARVAVQTVQNRFQIALRANDGDGLRRCGVELSAAVLKLTEALDGMVNAVLRSGLATTIEARVLLAQIGTPEARSVMPVLKGMSQVYDKVLKEFTDE